MKSLTRLPQTRGDLLPPHLLRLGTLLSSHSAELGVLLADAPIRKCQINNCLRRRLKSFRPFTTIHSKRERFRRKKRNLNLMHDHRGNLPTHVWHAKRMKMGKIWDRVLPLNVNDKGHRAIYRKASKSCVIHDMSYWKCFNVPLDQLPSELRLKCFDNSQFLQGTCRVVDMLQDSTGHVISPIYLLCHPSQPGHVLIWLHPSVTTPSSLSSFTTSNVGWFELRGPLSRKIAAVSPQCTPGVVLEISSSTVIATSQGCDILTLDRDEARSTWKKVIMAGASAIGFDDRRSLLDEWQIPQFPFASGNLKRLVATGSGIPREGEAITNEEGFRIGVCVRGGFSHRLGRGAGLAEVSEMSGKVFFSNHEATLEPLEWSCTDAPNFAPILAS